jgi:hypothetical protein
VIYGLESWPGNKNLVLKSPGMDIPGDQIDLTSFDRLCDDPLFIELPEKAGREK